MGRSLRGRYSGVVRYTDELVRALARHPDIAVTVLVTRADDGLDGVSARRVRAPFATPNEYTRALWEQAVVPFQAARSASDVYHSPNYILPLALRCPAVLTIHDLAFFDSSLHRLRSHLYLSVLTTISLRKAKRIICVSRSTRERLLERFPALEPRTVIVEEGVASRFSPRPLEEVRAFRRRHGLSSPYVLFVGTIEPRKNLVRLIKAFGRAMAGTGLVHDLVLVGQRGWKDDPVWHEYEISPFRRRIRFLDYVDDAELPAAYSGAEIFAYPSLHEGFGLPPLEAMACGIPVVTSNVTSLPEVVGNAALTVDPLNEVALADALTRLVRETGERERLSAAGQRRAARFSWDAAAKATVAVYREAVA